MIHEKDLKMAMKDPENLSLSEMDMILESQLLVLQELHKVYPKQPRLEEKNVKTPSSLQKQRHPKSVRRGLRNLRRMG